MDILSEFPSLRRPFPVTFYASIAVTSLTRRPSNPPAAAGVAGRGCGPVADRARAYDAAAARAYAAAARDPAPEAHPAPPKHHFRSTFGSQTERNPMKSLMKSHEIPSISMSLPL